MHNIQLLKKPSTLLLIALLLISVVFASLSYRLVMASTGNRAQGTGSSTTSSTQGPAATPPPLLTNSSKTLGVDGTTEQSYPGIPWIRTGYPTCGWGNLTGNVLKTTIAQYHKRGVRVLLTLCQNNNLAHLFDTTPFFDAAQGHPDAVQCGNEEMKHDASVSFLYISPENFARFYDLCEYEIHAINPTIPVLLGSLDPHVGGVDTQPLLDQVSYLNQMQQAMNTVVHPGGHWDWHTQTLGLIDSWHNGYPDNSVNSLQHLFEFWSQQFNVATNQVGKHLWVVEGTGCFKGCGIDDHNNAQVAVAHILTLITDVQAAMNNNVPFFYFSGKDFLSAGYYWPIGILDIHNNPKPLRQDLRMGARTLTLFCSNGKVTVADQEQLLARMYSGCSLPSNYADVLSS
jgi:hypothetical protein